MKTLIVYPIILSLLFPIFSYATEYQRESKVPDCKLTYDDINNILGSLRNHLYSFSSEEEKEKISESLKIEGGDLTIKKDGAFKLSKTDRLPKVGERLFYLMHCNYCSVSEVMINLQDSYNSITVAGESPDNVDAVIALLEKKFKDKTIIVGGKRFRFFGWVAMMLSAFVIFNLPFWIKGLKGLHKYSLMISGAAIYLCSLFLPFDKWLPGFAIYSDSASFITRYSAQISFIGVLLSVVFFIASVFISYKFSKN